VGLSQGENVAIGLLQKPFFGMYQECLFNGREGLDAFNCLPVKLPG